ncbi:efflux transporter outer membrane subunit [Rubellicoccus peritrichatus]|uniref:Efflux transporter outer membrane subunit n=1 Tax=Rubellicoccus peritrichatus TaxID=3080537 RepID=A0AAQ3LCR9_9BACT|nr:efflux transporter outer membrane subunit [Puniceicoccus sp. CR14]WOO43002.1 efflux transporter outer membrane subunit [Puniceicoccus sp. CR14]
MHLRIVSNTSLSALVLLLAGCAVSKDYEKPMVSTPVDYQFDPLEGEDMPGATETDRWWERFEDPILDQLLALLEVQNPSLLAARARVDQARATLGVSRSALYPELAADGSVAYARDQFQPDDEWIYNVGAAASYEVDLWGRVQRGVEASMADLQATDADAAAVRLALQADLATAYYSLRFVDAEIDLFDNSIELRVRQLELVQSQYDAGQVSRLALAQAETELARVRSQRIGLNRTRVDFENALAILVGLAPQDFDIEPLDLASPVPMVPPGIPSELLRRRPDIVTIERLMASAHARIGVAEADFYPRLLINGSGGYLTTSAGDLFAGGSNSLFSIGPAVSVPLFTGGRLESNLEFADAAYAETFENYRATILNAFREVENSLNAQQVLAEQEVAQRVAVEAAQNAARISTLRFEQGLVSYLEVVDSERARLEEEEILLQVQRDRYLASVFLVRALGGGFDESQLALYSSSYHVSENDEEQGG